MTCENHHDNSSENPLRTQGESRDEWPHHQYADADQSSQHDLRNTIDGAKPKRSADDEKSEDNVGAPANQALVVSGEWYTATTRHSPGEPGD